MPQTDSRYINFVWSLTPLNKCISVLQASYLVRQEDLEAVAHPVLRHRIITNFQAQAEGMSSTVIVDQLLDQFRDASA